jgi:hypothetical protein
VNARARWRALGLLSLARTQIARDQLPRARRTLAELDDLLVQEDTPAPLDRRLPPPAVAVAAV